ncbi:MAG: glycosyltransferase [Infirmifilum sp.]
MKVAFLVESWGEPWNEGYKNLAKYITETISNEIQVKVFSASEVEPFILNEFNVIHIFNYKPPFYYIPAFIKARKHVIKQIAKKELDINVATMVKNLFYAKLTWGTIVTSTDILREEVRRLVRDKPVYYIPPPIPVNHFRPLDKQRSRRIIGLDPSGVYIGYTGTLNRFRKLEMIGEALKLINDKRVTLVFSLTNINSGNICELRRFPLLNKVRLVKVKDVRYFYSSVDLLVFPVEQEGAVEPPLTVLEAMSCGSVVVAYKNMVTSRLILNGHNGFLFSSPEELAEIIRRFLNEEFDTGKIAMNARKTIMQYYDASKLRIHYLELYRQVSD